MSTKQRVRPIPTKLHLSIPPKTSRQMLIRMNELGILHYSVYIRRLVRADLNVDNTNALRDTIQTSITQLHTLINNLVSFFERYTEE